MSRTLPVWFGLVGVVVFLLTGQSMHWVHVHLRAMADGAVAAAP